MNDHDKDLVYNAKGTSDKDSRYDLDGDGNVDDCDVSLANAAIGNAVASDDLVTYPVLDSRSGRNNAGDPVLSSGICEVGHQGLFFEKEFNKYYVRARYYDPVLARMNQRDPAEYKDSMSFYEYVRSNPVNGFDPMGLWKYSLDGNFVIKELWDTPETLMKFLGVRHLEGWDIGEIVGSLPGERFYVGPGAGNARKAIHNYWVADAMCQQCKRLARLLKGEPTELDLWDAMGIRFGELKTYGQFALRTHAVTVTGLTVTGTALASSPKGLLYLEMRKLSPDALRRIAQRQSRLLAYGNILSGIGGIIDAGQAISSVYRGEYLESIGPIGGITASVASIAESLSPEIPLAFGYGAGFWTVLAVPVGMAGETYIWMHYRGEIQEIEREGAKEAVAKLEIIIEASEARLRIKLQRARDAVLFLRRKEGRQ